MRTEGNVRSRGKIFQDIRISSRYVYENNSRGKRNVGVKDVVSALAGMESSSQEENLLWTRLGWK